MTKAQNPMINTSRENASFYSMMRCLKLGTHFHLL